VLQCCYNVVKVLLHCCYGDGDGDGDLAVELHGVHIREGVLVLALA
jgi:hypothetical protein